MSSFKQKLNSYKVAELKSLLSSSNIEYHEKLKKAELIDLMNNNLEQKLGEMDASDRELLSDSLGIDTSEGADREEMISNMKNRNCLIAKENPTPCVIKVQLLCR